MENLIIMKAIIEKQRQDHKNTYILYADAEKCIDKFQLRDSLIEMERIGYNKSDIKLLYELNMTTEIVAQQILQLETQSIEIIEIVKQGSAFRPTMCCTTTAEVNDIREKVDYKYGEIEIGISIYMDDISVAGGPEEIKNKKE